MKRAYRDAASFVALIIGVGSGIAQLAGFSEGIGRLLLVAICVSCVLFLILRFMLLFYVRTASDLKRQLEVAKQQLEAAKQQKAEIYQQMDSMGVGHRRYIDTIDRTVEQEGAIYAESLEITVRVGNTDDEDMIIERRITTPHPRVTQRAIRPIVPDGAEMVIVENLAIEAAVIDDPSRVKISVLPLAPARNPRIWLVFSQGIDDPFAWEIRYRPRGLWKPLRETGRDCLKWDDRVPAGRGVKSALTKLKVVFLFPDLDKKPSVRERRGRGECCEAERLGNGGGWQLVWSNDTPDGHYYEWDLNQEV